MSIRETRKELKQTFARLNTVYLATVKETQPWMRPVTLIHQNLNFWIATNASSAKAKHIRDNPRVAFVLPLKKGKYSGYVRARARARRVKNKAEIKKVAKLCGFIDQYWKEGVDDRNLAIFRITPTKVLHLKPKEWEEKDVTRAIRRK